MDSQEILAQLIARSPLWAILPNYLQRLSVRLDTAWEAAKPSVQGKGPNKTAYIPVQGVLTKDGPAWLGSSYDSIADAAEKAGADDAVKHVILSVDSPGGEVLGLPETAAIIAQVAKVKPVSAMVEGTAASAAYWLTSQARNVNLTPSGEVGSVGVRMMHLDVSKAMEDAGLKVTELYSGNFKTEWSPYKPLSDEAIGDMQTRLAAAHNDFLNAVHSGRGDRVSTEMKGNRLGEGRMFGADAAVSNGLVDKIQTGREFYKSITPVQEEQPAAPRFGLQRAHIDIEKGRF